MLVATAGHQTASYSTTLHPPKATTSSSSSSVNNNNNTGDSANIVTTTSAAANATKRLCRDPLPVKGTLKESYNNNHTQAPANPTNFELHNNSLTNGLLKTLSVRISRGTEFIKDTVQKALINTATSSLSVSAGTNFSCSTSASNSSANAVGKYVAKLNGPANALNTAASASASSTSSSSAASAGYDKSQRQPLKRSHVKPTEEFVQLYALAPVHLHRNPEGACHDETDSIEKEYMCHFRPIRLAPPTPPKISSRSRGIAMKTPKAKFPPRVKVDFILKNPSLFADLRRKPSTQTLANLVGDADKQQQQQQQQQQNDNDDDGDGGDHHNDDDVIVYEYLKPKPNITTLPTIYSPPKHPSAFVYLIPHMRDITNAPSAAEKCTMAADRNAKAPKAKKPRIVRKFPAIAIDAASSAIATKCRTAATKSVSTVKMTLKRLKATKAAKTAKASGTPSKRTLAATATTNKKRKTTTTAATTTANTPAAGRVTRKKTNAAAGNALMADKKHAATTKSKRSHATSVKKSTMNALDAGKSPVNLVQLMQRAGVSLPRVTRSQLVHDERQLHMREQRLRANEERRLRNKAIDVTSSSSSSLQQIMNVHRARNVDTLKVPAKGTTAALPARKTKATYEIATELTASKRARMESSAYTASTSTATVGTTLEAPPTKAKGGRGRARLPAVSQPKIGDGVAVAKRKASAARPAGRQTPPMTRSRGRAIPLVGKQ